ncbi:MAG: hypothetical protein ACK4M7_10690, partial [Burkholderiales bacterium]
SQMSDTITQAQPIASQGATQNNATKAGEPSLAATSQASASPNMMGAKNAYFRTKQFGLQDELELGIEEETFFMAPKPAEPKAAPANEPARPAAPAYEHQRAGIRTEVKEEPRQPEKEPSKSGFSLFSRIRSKPNAEPEQARHDEEMAGHYNNKEDALEIPAFLRRKTPPNS